MNARHVEIVGGPRDGSRIALPAHVERITVIDPDPFDPTERELPIVHDPETGREVVCWGPTIGDDR